MNINEAVQYFGSGYELCKKLGIRAQNYSKWKKADWIPLKQQHKINDLVGGVLPIDIDREALNKRLSQNQAE